MNDDELVMANDDTGAEELASSFSQTAEAVSKELARMGPPAALMGRLYHHTCLVGEALEKEGERRGRPASPREQREYDLLALWAQMCSQFASEYLRVTIQQGAEMARLPKGPQLVDLRTMKNPPNPKALR